MAQQSCPLPVASSETGLTVLKALVLRRTLLAALEVMREEVGDVFQITLPSFQPAVFVGPTYNRHLLVTGRQDLLWRNEGDPVVDLLRHGLLVEDGDSHDRLRSLMDPPLLRTRAHDHVNEMVEYTDMVTSSWQDGRTVDMLVEMRRIALLILMGVLFGVEFKHDLDRLWDPIIRSIKYISPGFWIVWQNMPRPGYRRPLEALDEYLYGIIDLRRKELGPSDDLLGSLIDSGLDDDLIRDQLLTMLIAGHDTSTALLAWALFLLGKHPEIMKRVQIEVDETVGDRIPTVGQLENLSLLDCVVKETLRLYPPIHIGNRRTPEDTVVSGYEVPADTRVMYSIYLSHRHPKYWERPAEFIPERFDRNNRDRRPPAFCYLPFGGGPRNCIGAAFAQVEAKAILTRLLQQFDLSLLPGKVQPYMGATLEPRPGVLMTIKRRLKG